VLRFRLAADAEGRPAGRGLGAPRMLRGEQVRGHSGRGRRLGEVEGQVGGLPRDHGEQRVGP